MTFLAIIIGSAFGGGELLCFFGGKAAWAMNLGTLAIAAASWLFHAFNQTVALFSVLQLPLVLLIFLLIILMRLPKMLILISISPYLLARILGREEVLGRTFIIIGTVFVVIGTLMILYKGTA